MSVRWYIVNTLSGSEHKVAQMIKDFAAKRGLGDKFEDIVVPVENVNEIKKGKKIVNEKKIFPGYVLIKMHLDDASWNLVKNIPKVSGFLGANGKPMPVSDKEASRVLKQVAEGVVVKELEVDYEVGEVVKIMQGPFETFTGVIEELDLVKRKLKVSVSIFGRSTPVELDFSQVERNKRSD
jgi:transcription termination/antitermination protein NusG